MKVENIILITILSIIGLLFFCIWKSPVEEPRQIKCYCCDHHD